MVKLSKSEILMALLVVAIGTATFIVRVRADDQRNRNLQEIETRIDRIQKLVEQRQK